MIAPPTKWQIVKDLLRVWQLLAMTGLLLIGIYFLARQQIEIVVYKLLLVTLGGFAGYWVDRLVYPLSRPGRTQYLTEERTAQIRRAAIMCACIIGICWGA